MGVVGGRRGRPATRNGYARGGPPTQHAGEVHASIGEGDGVDPRIHVAGPALREPAEERVAPGLGEEGAVRDEDHAALAAGEHDVHPVERAEEAGGRGAHGGDDDEWCFVSWRKTELLLLHWRRDPDGGVPWKLSTL